MLNVLLGAPTVHSLIGAPKRLSENAKSWAH